MNTSRHFTWIVVSFLYLSARLLHNSLTSITRFLKMILKNERISHVQNGEKSPSQKSASRSPPFLGSVIPSSLCAHPWRFRDLCGLTRSTYECAFHSGENRGLCIRLRHGRYSRHSAVTSSHYAFHHRATGCGED